MTPEQERKIERILGIIFFAAVGVIGALGLAALTTKGLPWY